MRAAVFHGAHDIRIEDVAAPDSPGPARCCCVPAGAASVAPTCEYAMGPSSSHAARTG